MTMSMQVWVHIIIDVLIRASTYAKRHAIGGKHEKNDDGNVEHTRHNATYGPPLRNRVSFAGVVHLATIMLLHTLQGANTKLMPMQPDIPSPRNMPCWRCTCAVQNWYVARVSTKVYPANGYIFLIQS